jgi:hypothetical protein
VNRSGGSAVGRRREKARRSIARNGDVKLVALMDKAESGDRAALTDALAAFTPAVAHSAAHPVKPSRACTAAEHVV